jgi:hypothetical protein
VCNCQYRSWLLLWARKAGAWLGSLSVPSVSEVTVRLSVCVRITRRLRWQSPKDAGPFLLIRVSWYPGDGPPPVDRELRPPLFGCFGIGPSGGLRGILLSFDRASAYDWDDCARLFCLIPRLRV